MPSPSSPFLLCLLVFFFLLLSLPSSSSRLHARNLIVPTKSPQSRADKLIRGLNLSPKHDLNRGGLHGGRHGGAGVAPLMVERPLELASLIDGADSGNASVKDLGHHAGYFRLNNTKDARMFYFFFESRTKNTSAPVVIWLTGGPGCSSELALFYENGPFKITDDLSLTWNEFGWDKASNLIYVDQPTGTGFSYSSDPSDYRHDEDGVSTDLYNFLQAFFTKHPEYVKNDFYITGESYAGHYIPAFASRVQKGNQAKEGIIVNLKGFAIGNGLTNPELQYPAYPDFALDNKLIQKSDYDQIVQEIPPCVQATKLCQTAGGNDCLDALTTCEGIFDDILSIAGNINYYDIRKQCVGSLCYDFSNMEKFLNLDNVREALGVGDIEFVSCSSTVYNDMQTDWMKNLEVVIPQLLEDGIKSLIYAGEYDLICNWLGNSKWAHEMPWSGKKSFNAAPTVPFLVDGKEAGLLQSSGPLSFLKVHNAGHMVPMDQPNNALEMLKRWIEGSLKV